MKKRRMLSTTDVLTVWRMSGTFPQAEIAKRLKMKDTHVYKCLNIMKAMLRGERISTRAAYREAYSIIKREHEAALNDQMIVDSGEIALDAGTFMESAPDKRLEGSFKSLKDSIEYYIERAVESQMRSERAQHLEQIRSRDEEIGKLKADLKKLEPIVEAARESNNFDKLTRRFWGK